MAQMTTAAIVYCSATLTTAGLGEDIARVLGERGIARAARQGCAGTA
jgi:hypothetical protein